MAVEQQLADLTTAVNGVTAAVEGDVTARDAAVAAAVAAAATSTGAASAARDAAVATAATDATTKANAAQAAAITASAQKSANLGDLQSIPAAVATLGLREITDVLTVANDGTLSLLSQTPNGVRFALNVDGMVFRAFGSTPVFSRSGKTVTWNAANAPNGAALDPTDSVSATYTY